MITVTKVFRFEASHSLPYYTGDCHNLHGHSYKLEVTVSGNVIEDSLNPKCGMIFDFKDLNNIVKKEILSKLDHSHLNNIIQNPTAENIVAYIGDILVDEFNSMADFYYNRVFLVSVKLWETESSYAEYFPIDGGY